MDANMVDCKCCASQVLSILSLDPMDCRVYMVGPAVRYMQLPDRPDELHSVEHVKFSSVQ